MQCTQCFDPLVVRVNFTDYRRKRDQLICNRCQKREYNTKYVKAMRASMSQALLSNGSQPVPGLRLHPLITPEIAAILTQSYPVTTIEFRKAV